MQILNYNGKKYKEEENGLITEGDIIRKRGADEITEANNEWNAEGELSKIWVKVIPIKQKPATLQTKIEKLEKDINEAFESAGIDIGIKVFPTTGDNYHIMKTEEGAIDGILFANVKKNQIIKTLTIIETSINFAGIA